MMVKTSSAMVADDSTRPGMSGAAASGSFEVGTTSATRIAAAAATGAMAMKMLRPAEVLQQPAAHDRPHRDGHARDRAPQSDGASPFPSLGEDVGDQRERRRECHGGAQPHHRPGRDELRRAGREAAGQAGGAEHGQSGQQHALAAEPVGQAAEGEQQRGEDEVEGVDDPLQLSGGGMQLAHQGGKRHVHQGRVQVDEERCEQQRDENQGLGSHGFAFFTVISSVSRRVRVRLRARPSSGDCSTRNATNSRQREASPECACRVEYRCAARPHPKVLQGRPGCSVRGSGRAAGPVRRPRYGWRPRACPGRESRAS